MSIMTQLEFELNFSNSEKNIARYILNHGETVLNLSIKQLAKNTYTSPATIVRLCHKLGLEGYQDFKIKYSAELQYDNKNLIDVNFPFSKDDSTWQIVNKIAQLHQEALQDTLNLIDIDNLDQIVALVDQAKKIYLFGFGNSLLVGLDFQHKMMRINKLVEIRPNSGEQGFLSYTCTTEDIAIIISYSGETNELIDIAKSLKRRHIKVVAITSIGDNRLSKYSDYLINTGSREKIFSKIAPYASKTSISYILDLIFSCLFKLNYDQNIEEKLNNDKMFDHRHPFKSPINE
ncbi:MurR/RpiR family transcriptional regulator [uncultured Thomasclavelia sp.]|uniref:MurR/RpiR family transcriptional regulator n=1 Tax=uncultured Thomasclavelia sp. TaxID=3025759 RepID=UPI0025CE32AE|nr:MurR/RpiR family transcriptional regulator [uncultured Thomasclavelia sp.]